MQTVSLKHWRFISFLSATFLGAFNDNAFKLVVSMASLSLITEAAKQQSYLAMTSALAILPFILFSGYAGYLADRYCKSNVLRISKAAEILAMLAALTVFATGQSITHLLITLFLLALHSAFFSPSKYSILPEILAPEDLPKANGYLNMLTFVAIILGSLSGATLWGMFKQTPEIIGIILTGIAVLGTLLCLFVPQSAPGNAQKSFKLNPFSEITGGLNLIPHYPLLGVCMFGSAIFWMLGGLIYLSLIMLGRTDLGLSESAAGSLFAFLAAGIAAGSVAAGYLVDNIAPRKLSIFGALTLAIGCILTGFLATGYAHTAILMSLIGIGGGIFIVPVVTMLQKHAPEKLRGQLLATTSFFDMAGVLLASGMFWLLGTQAGLSAAMIILAAGVLSLLMLGAFLTQQRPKGSPAGHKDTLARRFIMQAKHRPFAARMNDTTGVRLTGLTALVGARLMARWMGPKLTEAQNVAILLPASIGGALANIALAMLAKTSVNLNFSLTAEATEQAIAKAEIRQILTARKMVKKLGLAEDTRMLFIEDAMMSGALQKLKTMAEALFLPGDLLCRLWLRGVQNANATATILFSSGSTSAPKAVMLSHNGIIANIESLNGLLQQAEHREDTSYALAGTLPFFHSFGLTTGLWMPAITGRRVSYHSNPLDAKTVVAMIAKNQCQVLITVPTFARHYIHAAKNAALDAVRLVILGGEKLSEIAEDEFAQALPHANILQGYGATELGPVVAINTPDAHVKGSVGKPIPGVTVKIADRESGSEITSGQEGLILVKSPSLMQGYYGDPALTYEVSTDGWYFTGDIGMLDANGFLYITDRLARFSKIGGEMVPHGKLEDMIGTIIAPDSEVAVVAIADAQKGEKLCVLTTETNITPAEIHERLKQSGLPNLWIPARDNIFTVTQLPQLASGKRDLRATKTMASELAAPRLARTA